ncbi:protein O-GlcNAcase [Paenibacillus sp. HB172176]|uniref:protein O-GlcNAcase n=1 Tax=Paenibacillus sp. HB172176 TaxID=2493690 RepID=UPI001439F9AC|nr:protein O-GlcNAcase [Paenibacillus sp. HB172176]
MSMTLSADCDNSTDLAFIRYWSNRHGYRFTTTGEGDIHIHVVRSNARRFTYIEELCRASDEIYEMALEGAPAKAVLKIMCSSIRGLRYALNLFRKKPRQSVWNNDVAYEYPHFPLRGIVEGFYGKPWTFAQRLDMLQFIADQNMNAYIYAPKDDAYHREKWRELYNEEAGADLQALMQSSQALGLHFYYCIAPGLSMQYSSEEDYAALLLKAKQLYQLGIRRFGLLLDDIPEELQHAEDRLAYPDLAAAHIRLINRCFHDLRKWDSCIELIVCPTQYWGKGEEYYITALGQAIHPSIDLFWTGRNICSQEITLMEAAVFTRNASRPPLYWDNYPVNDMEMTDELHIGPYRQRDAKLYCFSRGIIANGMSLPESSKIAFATIADYAWNPVRYDSEHSWRKAIGLVVGGTLREDFLRFADNVRYSCLHPSDAPQLEKALTRFEFEYKHEKTEERPLAIKRMKQFALRMAESAQALRASSEQYPALMGELERWLCKYEQGCELLLHAIDYLDNDASGGALEQLQSEYAWYRQDSAYVFGDVLASFMNKLLDQGFTK